MSADTIPGEVPSRLAARVIDFLLLTAVGWAVGQSIGFGLDWLVSTAAGILAYFVAADVLAGTTLGKAAMKLRVLGPHGGKPTAKEAFLREWFVMLGAIPFVGPLLALAAWVWMFRTIRASPLRRGWHDRMAGGTTVVHVGPAAGPR